MTETCKNCRFFKENKCNKFNVTVSESYTKCADFAESKPLNETVNKIQLND